MSRHTVRARPLVKGVAVGEALVCHGAFSFLGDVDMDSGAIIAKGHEHQGTSISGKVMICPETKGSPGGCIVLMALARQGKQPAAIVLEKPADPNIVEGAILTGVSMVCQPQESLTRLVRNGTRVEVNGTTGEVSWSEPAPASRGET